MREIKVNLDIDNSEQVVRVYCSKIKGTIKVVFIDEDTGEEIKSETMKDLELGEHIVKLEDPKGYKIIDKEEEKKEEIREEKEFNIEDFCKSLAIKIGDDE